MKFETIQHRSRSIPLVMLQPLANTLMRPKTNIPLKKDAKS